MNKIKAMFISYDDEEWEFEGKCRLVSKADKDEFTPIGFFDTTTEKFVDEAERFVKCVKIEEEKN